MELTQDYCQEIEPRVKKIAGIVLVCMLLVIGRLYYLQAIRGNFYRLFSEENSIREAAIPALRGMMLDRNGVALVENRAAFDLVLIPQYVLDKKKVFSSLERFLNIPRPLLETAWSKRLGQPAYQPIVLLEDTDMDVVSWVRSHKSPWGRLRSDLDLRGVEVRLRYEREYPDSDIASHVLGYLREVDRERLKKLEEKTPGRYRKGDQVGIGGLEQKWDLVLRGEDGFQQKVVNAVGREISFAAVEEDLIQKEAKGGAQLQLTLDSRLQKIARNYFQGKRGAAVALDPRDGAVLLFYSAPSFDLNRLGGEKGNEYWSEIADHPDRTLLNRAVQGAYPPGSTYKMVVGLAGLQEGVIKPGSQFHCSGGLQFGNRRFGCWKSEGHGTVSIHGALVASCDVFFYNVGLKLGVDRLARYAQGFGLGSLTGIGFPSERSGLIPTSEWKQRVYKSPWHEGETLSIAIGQGYNLVTPLQSAVMISVIANGGRRVHPYLVKNQPTHPSSPKDVVFSKETVEIIRKSLIGVVAEDEGTAHRLSLLQIPMGGKTGTSQVVSLGKSCGGGRCEDHAWFVAFAPAENPVIAIAVLVENGGHGSSAAAPLAGELIKEYLGESLRGPTGPKQSL